MWLQLEKWSSKAAFSTPVPPTRFIPMKTPLSQALLRAHFSNEQPCQHPNTIDHLLAFCRQQGFALGLIINLAAHDCLYAADLPGNLPMQQVQLAAKVLPPPQAVQQVLCIADAFWQAHPEQYVAVHCDYGVQRRLAVDKAAAIRMLAAFALS
jgi:hypothetical protein